MKIRLVAIVLLACTGITAPSHLTSTTATTIARAQVPGGWTKASVKDEGVLSAAQYAIKAEQKVMKEAGNAKKLSLVKIQEAQSQVVQGVNYKLTLHVTIGEAERTAQAVVWVRQWLKEDERFQLTSWKLQEAAK
ncbi:MAG: hypothetical protein RIS70_2595 [Planctomycetota bacterium]|jgi:hypothetical protein